MTPRLQATHFIEQYSYDYDKKLYAFTGTEELSDLKHFLRATATIQGLQTVAVWKIKFKNSSN